MPPIRMVKPAAYVAFLFGTHVGFACTCGGPFTATRNPTNMRETAASVVDSEKVTRVIFEGVVEHQEMEHGSANVPQTAMSMTFSGGHRIVSFRASRVYRGPHQQHFTVFTGSGGGDCGYDFDTGKKYLVFADKSGTDELSTNICTPTALANDASPYLRYLRGESPAREDLLDLATYHKQFYAKRWGTVCGRITGLDNKPIAKARVEMTEIRDEPFPPRTASDPDLSKSDGTYCIQALPGRYVLTAEVSDFDHSSRLIGFYPGGDRQLAIPIDVVAQDNRSGTDLTVFTQALYTIRIRVVMAEGGPLPWQHPWDHLSVAVVSPERDALAYKVSHGVNENGSYTFGYAPPGHYTIKAYIHSSPEEFAGQRTPEDLSMWEAESREVDISGDTEVALKLTRKK
jgi:hypothetical protein